jgi:hypothetical protein
MSFMRVRTFRMTRAGWGLRIGSRTEHNSKCRFYSFTTINEKKLATLVFGPLFFMKMGKSAHNIITV